MAGLWLVEAFYESDITFLICGEQIETRLFQARLMKPRPSYHANRYPLSIDGGCLVGGMSRGASVDRMLTRDKRAPWCGPPTYAACGW